MVPSRKATETATLLRVAPATTSVAVLTLPEDATTGSHEVFSFAVEEMLLMFRVGFASTRQGAEGLRWQQVPAGAALPQATPQRARPFGFFSLCCLIAGVSVHDAYLLLHNRQTILAHEKNPLGRWLLEWAGGDVWLFVAVKLTTTSAVTCFLIERHRCRPSQTRWIAAGLAAFQLTLLFYLSRG